MAQSMISSGCAKSLAQNSQSLGYHTHTPHSDSVTVCVTTGHRCDDYHTFSTGNLYYYSDQTSHFKGQNITLVAVNSGSEWKF